jgi:hypothetical protein
LASDQGKTSSDEVVFAASVALLGALITVAGTGIDVPGSAVACIVRLLLQQPVVTYQVEVHQVSWYQVASSGKMCVKKC